MSSQNRQQPVCPLPFSKYEQKQPVNTSFGQLVIWFLVTLDKKWSVFAKILKVFVNVNNSLKIGQKLTKTSSVKFCLYPCADRNEVFSRVL